MRWVASFLVVVWGYSVSGFGFLVCFCNLVVLGLRWVWVGTGRDLDGIVVFENLACLV